MTAEGGWWWAWRAEDPDFRPNVNMQGLVHALQAVRAR